MSNHFYVATRKGLFLFDRRRDGWTMGRSWFVGDNCTCVLPDPRDGSVYAALHHGHFGDKLHRSDDGGGTWEEVAVPAYPEPPDGVEPGTPEMGKPAPWALKLLWTLEAADPHEPGSLWCGTIPGGLFHSEDRGATWDFNRTLWDDPRRMSWFGGGYDHPGIHSISVDPRDARRVTVAVSCGGVWITEDGGVTWKLGGDGMRAEYMPPERAGDPTIQDPHRLVACRGCPDTMWVQHHNGIFRSDDGGWSWREFEGVTPSNFGFAVAVHPSDPDTAWFVPALKDEKRVPVDGRFVVNRTRDGGRHFETITEGLPDEPAWDLVFRHALDVDETGEVLAVGSTTGSLWISEDGGGRWTALTHHLPPVHGVRFVTQED